VQLCVGESAGLVLGILSTHAAPVEHCATNGSDRIFCSESWVQHTIKPESECCQCAATSLYCCGLQMAEYIRNERNVLDKLHHPGVTQLHFTFQVGAPTVSAVTVTVELCGPSCKTAVRGQQRGNTAEQLHCCVMYSRVAQRQAVNCTVSGRESCRQGQLQAGTGSGRSGRQHLQLPTTAA
jgi:hypothetical protein